MKNDDWWELGWVIVVVGAVILALHALSGCGWDDQPEREFFLVARQKGWACMDVLGDEDIKGHYCAWYYGPIKSPGDIASPSPSPSPSEVTP